MAKKSTLVLKKKSPAIDTRIDSLYQKIFQHIRTARQRILQTIDTEMVNAYWLAGKDIVEEQQHGKKRVDYGSYVIRELSRKMTKELGRGFGETTIRYMRNFYLAYSAPIHHTPCDESTMPLFNSNLGWSHYPR